MTARLGLLSRRTPRPARRASRADGSASCKRPLLLGERENDGNDRADDAAERTDPGLFTQKGLPRGLRGRWAARFLKRYRDETVFLSPPMFLQRALIALLAHDD